MSDSMAKNYLRSVFHISALDVTHSYEVVRGFVRVFAGEPEAIRAVEQCSFLTPHQRGALIRIARGSK